MGGCFSSGSYEEDGCQPTRVRLRVRPSDDDGMPCVGERDVDIKAGNYIKKFHQQQSDGTEVPPTPAPAPFAV